MTRYSGSAASEGVAYGTLRHDIVVAAGSSRPASGVTGAIVETAAQLRALKSATAGLGSDILEFQLELLEDDDIALQLLVSAEAEGDVGRAVDRVFDEQIESYRSAKSEQFAARAADLADLKSRLQRAIKGVPPEAKQFPAGTILLADEMTPSRFLELDRSNIVGIVDQRGSAASHVALLARSEGVPMLVGAGPVMAEAEGQPVLLDANRGELVIDPEAGLAPQRANQASSKDVPDTEGIGAAVLPDGGTVQVNLIVNALATLDEAPAEWFDAIGLVRTELLIREPEDLLNADRQADLYRPLFGWAGERPVTVRLLDGGGDKQIPGYAPPQGAGGFLGVRGARLLMRRIDVLRVQLQAILKAAANRPVRIMVPMVTLPQEMQLFRAELESALDQTGSDRTTVQLGMMVETPAAALDISQFDADFLALGTNDLAQYTLAASRESDALPTSEETPSAVLELVRRVVEHGAKNGLPVTVCGDVAISSGALGRLLECGVRSFCIPARFSPRFKQYIRTGN